MLRPKSYAQTLLVTLWLRAKAPQLRGLRLLRLFLGPYVRVCAHAHACGRAHTNQQTTRNRVTHVTTGVSPVTTA